MNTSATRTHDQPPTIALRAPRCGDMGWVVSRHGALYGAEYGWDWRFEALVARIVADFIERFDSQREACWIAEAAVADGAGGGAGGRVGDRVDDRVGDRDCGRVGAGAGAGDVNAASHSKRLGCVFLVQARDEATGAVIPGVAQLRMLIVEPAARGLGLGRRLVDTCSVFARQAGYRKIRLWTNDMLDAARHIYQSGGYRLVASEPHESFGHKMVGEIWELELVD